MWRLAKIYILYSSHYLTDIAKGSKINWCMKYYIWANGDEELPCIEHVDVKSLAMLALWHTFGICLVYWMEIMTWIVIFITGNKVCCNVITKYIHYFGCEL